MATLVAQTDWKHPKSGGTSFSVTLSHTPAAGHTLVFVSNGGAIATPSFSGTNFSRTAAYGSGAQDSSIWYRTATGAETAIAVSLNGSGDNVGGTILEFSGTLTYNTASTNGSGASAAQTSDYQVAPASVAVSAQSLCVATFAVAQSTAISAANQFHRFGPYGSLVTSDAEQDASGSTKVIYAVGIADIDATHSYPANLAAGHYQATSAYLSGSGTAFATQAVFTDTSGVATVAAAANPIVKENSLPGCDNSNWYVNAAGSMSGIAGFPTTPSVLAGGTMNFKVDSSAATFRVEIYRLGWYGYDNFSARNVLGNQAGYITGTVLTQPTPVVDSTLGSTSCAAWTTNASWSVPSDAAPGLYYVVFRRTDAGNTAIASTSHFVVRESAVTGKIPIIIPDTTHHAYSRWGATTDHGDGSTGTYTGRSLYQAGSDGGSPNFAHRSYAVCFDRPYSTQATQAMTYIFDSEFGFIVFAEAQGYNLTYLSDIDMENNTTLLNDAKMFALVGHHEYWSANMYTCVQNAIAAGVNSFIYSSNTAGWRVRFAAGDTNKRTAICYKDSGTRDVSAGFTGTGYDPVSPTGTWRDATATNGVANPDRRPEIATTGQRFVASGPVQTPMLIDFSVKGKPLWRNSSSVQALTSGTHITDISNSIGYEIDSADSSIGQPSNLTIVASTSVSVTTGANANGTVYTTSTTITATWTLYRDATNGALVFNSGNWRSWWSATRWQGSSRTASVSLDISNALLAILYDLGATPTALNTMQPGIDTALTNPATGAPTPGNSTVATAYGLTVPSGQTGTAALSSTPTLSSAATDVKPATTALSTTATLAATGDHTAPATTALSSTPTLTSTAGHTAPATSALSSTPTLAANATSGQFPTVALSSTPALSGGATVTQPAGAALTSTPTLAASGVDTVAGTATLSTTPTLAATGAHLAPGAATLSATPVLTATALDTAISAATLSSTPGLTASGTHTGVGVAALSSTPTLAASNAPTVPAAVALSSTPGLTASTDLVRPGVAALSSTPTLAVTALRSRPGAAVLSSTPALTGSALTGSEASVALVATPGLTASTVVRQPATAVLACAPTLTASTRGDAAATVALTAVGALGVTGGGPVGAAALSSAPTLTARGIAGSGDQAALSTTPVLIALGRTGSRGAVALSSEPTLFGTAGHGVAATVALSVVPVLTALLRKEAVAVVTLSTTPRLVALVSIPITFLNPLVSSPILAATAVGRPEGSSATLAAVGALVAGAQAIPYDPVMLVCSPTLTAGAFVTPIALPYRLRLAPRRWIFALLEQAGEEIP